MTQETVETSATGEDVLAMGDIGPCELIDGEVVKLTPTGAVHGQIETSLSLELGLFVRERNLGWVLGGEVGLYTRRNPDRVRGADVVVLSHRAAPEGPSKGFLEVAPEVVVEIMSPADTWQAVQEKLEEYLAIGVEQVWIVEPENRSLSVYRSATEIWRYSGDDSVSGEGLLAGFEISLKDLFGRA
jgi:Uma2 family endonuclease